MKFQEAWDSGRAYRRKGHGETAAYIRHRPEDHVCVFDVVANDYEIEPELPKVWVVDSFPTCDAETQLEMNKLNGKRVKITLEVLP